MADVGVALLRLMPLFVLLAAGLIVAVVCRLRPKGLIALRFTVSISAHVAAFVLSWYEWALPTAGDIGPFAFDRFAMAGWIIIIFSNLVANVIALSYVKGKNPHGYMYYATSSIAAFGLMLVVATDDIVVFLAAITAAFTAIAASITALGERPRAIEAAAKYLFGSAIASAFFAFGAAFIFGSVGTSDLSLIAIRASEITSQNDRTFFMFGVSMIIAGMGIFAFLAPFHAWFVDAADGSSTPVSAVMLSAWWGACMLFIFRVATAAFVTYDEGWLGAVGIISALSMFAGSLAALRQYGLKRLFAYLAVANSGYCMMLLSSTSDISAQAPALLMFVVACSMAMLGGMAVSAYFECTSSGGDEINRLAGLSTRMPFIAAALSVFLLSLVGVPFLIGFPARFSLLLSVAQNGNATISIASAIASVIMCVAVIHPISVMYFRNVGSFRSSEASQAKASEAIPLITAVLIACAITALYFGIFPNDLMLFLNASGISR
jgi:NADH-quinone oxidoreductase subunit N